MNLNGSLNLDRPERSAQPVSLLSLLNQKRRSGRNLGGGGGGWSGEMEVPVTPSHLVTLERRSEERALRLVEEEEEWGRRLF